MTYSNLACGKIIETDKKSIYTVRVGKKVTGALITLINNGDAAVTIVVYKGNGSTVRDGEKLILQGYGQDSVYDGLESGELVAGETVLISASADCSVDYTLTGVEGGA